MIKWIIMLPCLFISGIKIIGQDNFKLAKEKDGIRVWVGPVSESDYFAFKAQMLLSASEAEILKILKEVDNYPKWFAFTSSVILISQQASSQRFVLETDYPWPYSNECMEYTMKFDDKRDNKRTISIKGNKSVKNCKYELKEACGYILLEAEERNTKITYYFHSEPYQKIPAWLINSKIHEMPYQTFVALRKIVKMGKQPL